MIYCPISSFSSIWSSRHIYALLPTSCRSFYTWGYPQQTFCTGAWTPIDKRRKQHLTPPGKESPPIILITGQTLPQRRMQEPRRTKKVKAVDRFSSCVGQKNVPKTSPLGTNSTGPVESYEFLHRQSGLMA
jgi:hypothetical protein